MLEVSVVAFLLLNVAAHYYLKSHPPDAADAGLFVHRNSPKGVAIRSRIFQTDDLKRLNAYSYAPNIRPHTVLHFTEGRSKGSFDVGIEGIRYLPGWTDESVAALLSEAGLVYVFGGSTTFGHGVSADATVVAHLDRQDPRHRYVNFAVQAHDSIREVDKLLYLLRKGYRPEQVIFIDGLNDVTTFARSPYEVHDSPRTQGLILDRGEVPLIFGYPTPNNMLLALAYSFPVTHVMVGWRRSEPEPGPQERRPASLQGREDWQELMRHHYDWASIHAEQPDRLAADVIRYYEEAIAFVHTLGEAFGFTSWFVYQPIGLLEDDQPFLTEAFRESDQYVVYRSVDAGIRQAIRSGRLAMQDCSRSIASQGAANAYVDATHYSPLGGRLLAACIIGESPR